MINFKPHTRADIPYRIKWLNDKEANKFVLDDPAKQTDEKEQLTWFDEYDQSDEKKFFTIFDDETPVGFMGLSRINRSAGSAEVFMMIGDSQYRGKGVGTKAMEFLIDYAWQQINLAKLTLEVAKGNSAAIRLNDKFSFKRIGENDKEIFMVLEK